MHNSNWARAAFAFLLFSTFATTSFGQYGDFGLPNQPADTASVDDIIYYGDYMDMSGGYNVGDTVFNFTAYDFDGNPVELYQELAGNKPVVLVSGSVSCIRFRNVFDPALPGQEVWSARNFIYDHQEDFNWIYIYGVEAHPTDGNCPSNCPPTVNTDTAVVQPSIYSERRWAMQDWLDSPIHDFPFTMYADNPDNSIYNHFFQRPFGLIAMNCDGTVGLRADWVTNYFADPANVQAMLDFRQNYETCQINWNPVDNEDDDDTEDPIEYDGPLSDLFGHIENGSVNDVGLHGESKPLAYYPNPAQETILLNQGAGTVQWVIADSQGRWVKERNVSVSNETWYVGDLPRGSYILFGMQNGQIALADQLILN
ncbi:MAG: T9SS type A sorting domain-containing protein [Bacteroidetes bacterium]|nr:T9SS type A sorting domain-containing protein [Bacteroidota bacterium]MDA1335417.1 T9SS type A sorting domain-containing protein [Bacteroidota bacterium]